MEDLIAARIEGECPPDTSYDWQREEERGRRGEGGGEREEGRGRRGEGGGEREERGRRGEGGGEREEGGRNRGMK